MLNKRKETADMQELTACMGEMLDILQTFKSIKQVDFVNQSQLHILNNRFMDALKKFPDLVTFAAVNKTSIPEAGIKFKNALNYMSEILDEKARIFNNTPQLFKDLTDMSWFNLKN